MNPNSARRHLAALLFAVASSIGLTGPAAAQEQAPTDPKTEPKKVQKLAEWPTPAAADRERLPGLLGQLKKDSAELQDAARQALIAIGDGAASYLLQQVNDRDEAINARLFQVFDGMLGPAHATLMAREAKKNKPVLRRYLMQRLCRFGDPELKPTFQGALKDKDEEVVFSSQLGLAALHDKPALAAMVEYARTQWDDRRAAIAAVLPGARCEDCGRAVAEALPKAAPAAQAAGLRLLRYVALEAQAGMLRGYLSSEDHVVKKEAVNTMRALHGQEPIENLSVFQAIEMAKEWLSK